MYHSICCSFLFIGGNRNDDSQARGQAGLAKGGTEPGRKPVRKPGSRAKKKKRSESQGVRDNQGQPFGERVRDNLLGEPAKRTQPFGEASFWGSNLLVSIGAMENQLCGVEIWPRISIFY